MGTGRIRVGIGGWTYEPWRGTFFPEKWPKARELDYVAQRMTAVEVNGTYYGSQKPATFAAWAKAAPEGFVFSLKASRFATNRRVLAEGEASVQKFLGQGIVELGDKLGPIVWQFMPTKKFDPEDFAAFLKLLPGAWEGVALSHVVDVRHESFIDPAFTALCAEAGVAIVHTDSPEHPEIEERTGPVTYMRLMNAREEEETGYSGTELDDWAVRAREKAKDGRDVFVFMINGAKVRAPAAAEAMIARLRGG